MMFRNIVSLILCLVILTSAASQTIYLKMDEACMNRLEYTANNSQNPYVSYSFKLGDKQFATFDVGMESNKGVQALPGKLTFCNAIKVDQEFVKKVNDGSVKLYIVKESATQYFVSQVDKASYLATIAGAMDFSGDDAQFSMNLSNPISGVNLALPGSKSEVYLDGTINYQCLRGYIIQKKEARDSRSFKEYVIVPELGMVERSSVAKSGFVDDLLRDNVFKLSQLDGTNFQSVLSNVCDRMQASYYDATTGTTRNSNNDTVTPKSGKTTIPTSYGGGDPCAPTTDPGVHVVQKGETLYSLSKRYGVQVAQIQGWNNLANSTTISICQRLWVKEPSTAGTTPQNTEKGGTSTTPTTSTGYWTQSSGEHLVRAGEAVASLAKMYGYTEERFRKMNGLSPTETVLPGQRLRTNDCNCPTLESTTKDTPLPYDQPTETVTSKEPSSTPVDKQDVYYRPISVYVVQASDTFFKIAQQYNTTVERILELNGMTKNDKLTEGMRIYVQ